MSRKSFSSPLVQASEKRIVIFRVFALCFVILLPMTGMAEVSVAYVDAARLLKDAPQVEQIKARIRDEFRARDKRLVEMQKQMEALSERLGPGSPRLTAEEKERLQQDLATRKLQYRRARDELEQDKQLRFSEEEERFTRIIHEVIAQVAQDRKLDLVLQGGVIWVAPRIDITEVILARLRELAEQKG